LAGLLPTEGLRLVEKTATGQEVRFGENVLGQICESLGVIPDPGVSRARGLVLVEGAGDVIFLRHTGNTLKAAGYLPSTLEEKSICVVSIGGCGNLKHWRTKKLADQFGIPWAILLDSDLGTPEQQKNKDAIDELRTRGKKAYLTRKREPENYILPEIVAPFVQNGAPLIYTDTDDAKKMIGVAVVKRPDAVLETFWQLMTAAQIRKAECYVDDAGQERFELTEMLRDFLTLV
jgi:hypothetical protein